ncbi:hypothetical protein [Bradyrhizobium sp. URHA0013]|uniref:hypothetical protein n=1 Tax=Bradyrhizobium sp. URHA0013 TaxID=1380352 RepID=UPI000485B593|nr:hypothetical protein [Bradyrhizobium sp. URHA0013]
MHEFGTDEDGDPITVNIVSPSEVSAQSEPKSREPKLSPDQRTFYRILHDAGPAGMDLEDWNEKARQVGIGANRKAKLYDLRKALEDKCMVREYGGRWNVNHG